MYKYDILINDNYAIIMTIIKYVIIFSAFIFIWLYKHLKHKYNRSPQTTNSLQKVHKREIEDITDDFLMGHYCKDK